MVQTSKVGYIKINKCTQSRIEITVVFENFVLYAYNKVNKLENSEVF